VDVQGCEPWILWCFSKTLVCMALEHFPNLLKKFIVTQMSLWPTMHRQLLLALQTFLLLHLIQAKHLRFNKHGTFTIAQITDLHYGESDIKDACSTKVCNVPKPRNQINK
jgi:hypothetical protein